MIETIEQPLRQIHSASVWLMLSAIALSMVLGVLRLARGPSLADRVVALDLIAVSGVGLMAAAALGTGLPYFLEIGILLALIGFVGTAAFAGYIERRRR
jgi:multicomponent Na+:H+ antiporter subunit F